jgi:hypothetical protein
MQTPDFRHLAADSLARAKAEIGASDPHRLRYAALELRGAMEALTYDRALAFKNLIPPEEYKAWQPRKLMAVLLDIDPSIGTTSTVAVGVEEEYGKPAAQQNMKVLGTDVVFTLADLKAHYDAVGSYLHTPSLELVLSGKVPDLAKLWERCETIVGLIDKVLKSPVWNLTLGVTATLNHCMNEKCGKPIHKRIPSGEEKSEVTCFECKAEYTIKLKGDVISWNPKTINVGCSNPECSEKMALWPHEIKPGTHWRCRSCGTRNGIALTITKVETENNCENQ